ncbi:N-acetylmuramoyl-L-alanine amidase [Parabacteroides sp. Marseille-P3160]|uniref:N-acetylmuramoyl-L-alanine amidase family protein n=1 Tax=Parabacteroides sp. Marseille-P3160 TaxID=1917887 RepID=UPI003510A274
MYFIYNILLFLCIFSCHIPLWGQEKAKPKNGDGITTFLMRYNRSGDDYQRQFIELNKTKLGKNNSLLMGVTYTLPPLKKRTKDTDAAKPVENRQVAGTFQTEPLFGKKRARYEIKSTELKGATFYVCSGHGGPDPGAIGTMDGHSLHEDEYAYDIALRLAYNLKTRGANVYIVVQDAVDGIRDERILENSKRETCMGEAIPLGQVARLQQRTSKINALDKKEGKGYSRGIFIHIDSRSKSSQTDVFFYHSSKSGSKQLANTMVSTFARKYDRHQPGRGFTGTVSKRNLYVLNHSEPASVFIELGNIRNSFDQRRLVIADNRQALANWMCEALITDYNHYKKKK